MPNLSDSTLIQGTQSQSQAIFHFLGLLQLKQTVQCFDSATLFILSGNKPTNGLLLLVSTN